jgi:FMN phosphatase YigB (HAD superfamily)
VRVRPTLLVTDLDNTLYDWVTFFARAFQAMVVELETLLGVSEDQLLTEFKAVHERYGSSEQPFAVFDLPAVKSSYPGASRRELRECLAPALLAFNATRDRELALYPGVQDTLETLRAAGVTIVGHTEATAANAYYRVTKLRINGYFKHLYVAAGKPVRHPDPSRAASLAPPRGLVTQLPNSERKPNPSVLIDICRREGIPTTRTVYVGDSLTKDIGMALAAGTIAAWARYGLEYDRSLWNLLVRVTHWTDADAARESELRQLPVGPPDVVLDSFEELVRLFAVGKAEVFARANARRNRPRHGMTEAE